MNEKAQVLPIALDAMGGDHAPNAVIEGALLAQKEGIEVILVGPKDQVGDTKGLPLFECSEVISMDEDPAQGVRRKKDSSLVRAAELVRDTKASAMISAGNTGATMASALLRMGRLKGVSRPAIATPLPRLGKTPAILVDSGANSECSPQMLVQFASMGSAYVKARYGITEPSVGLLSIGEEDSKGTPLVKETHKTLRAATAPKSSSTKGLGFRFVGNLEGRDILPSPADVIVTDGFTGNVTLKTLEGSLRFLLNAVLGVFSIDETTKAAGEVLLPHLLPLAGEFDPENTGGAMLLGVNGVCVISHGSSGPTAILNALRVANELCARSLVSKLADAITAAAPILDLL